MRVECQENTPLRELADCLQRCTHRRWVVCIVVVYVRAALGLPLVVEAAPRPFEGSEGILDGFGRDSRRYARGGGRCLRVHAIELARERKLVGRLLAVI